jgi:hypothetical protein
MAHSGGSMNVTLVKALVALLPVTILLAWSVRVLEREKTLGSVLQFIGTASLLIVVLTHVAEARHLFVFMGWGDAHSAGHYLDLCSAIVGLTLAPVGLLLRVKGRNSVPRTPESPNYTSPSPR